MGTKEDSQLVWNYAYLIESDKRKVYKANEFDLLLHVILFIFAHNVHPKRSGKNEIRNSNLYFLDEMMYENTEILGPSPFCTIVINYMWTLARMVEERLASGSYVSYHSLLSTMGFDCKDNGGNQVIPSIF